MKPETRRWMQRAHGNLDLAGVGLKRSHYELCVFHCQQAMEMLLKGLLVEQGDRVPRSHDLLALVHELGLAMSDDDMGFLGRLSEQYIPARYGDGDVEYPREVAQSYLDTTRRLYSWLLQRLS